MSNPSHNHKQDCTCTLCKAAASKLSSDEKIVLYGIKVPESLRDGLKRVGAERVRETLELLCKNA